MGTSLFIVFFAAFLSPNQASGDSSAYSSASPASFLIKAAGKDESWTAEDTVEELNFFRDSISSISTFPSLPVKSNILSSSNPCTKDTFYKFMKRERVLQSVTIQGDFNPFKMKLESVKTGLRNVEQYYADRITEILANGTKRMEIAKTTPTYLYPLLQDKDFIRIESKWDEAQKTCYDAGGELPSLPSSRKGIMQMVTYFNALGLSYIPIKVYQDEHYIYNEDLFIIYKHKATIASDLATKYTVMKIGLTADNTKITFSFIRDDQPDTTVTPNQLSKSPILCVKPIKKYLATTNSFNSLLRAISNLQPMVKALGEYIDVISYFLQGKEEERTVQSSIPQFPSVKFHSNYQISNLLDLLEETTVTNNLKHENFDDLDFLQKLEVSIGEFRESLYFTEDGLLAIQINFVDRKALGKYVRSSSVYKIVLVKHLEEKIFQIWYADLGNKPSVTVYQAITLDSLKSAPFVVVNQEGESFLSHNIEGLFRDCFAVEFDGRVCRLDTIGLCGRSFGPSWGRSNSNELCPMEGMGKSASGPIPQLEIQSGLCAHSSRTSGWTLIVRGDTLIKLTCKKSEETRWLQLVKGFYEFPMECSVSRDEKSSPQGGTTFPFQSSVNSTDIIGKALEKYKNFEVEFTTPFFEDPIKVGSTAAGGTAILSVFVGILCKCCLWCRKRKRNRERAEEESRRRERIRTIDTLRRLRPRERDDNLEMRTYAPRSYQRQGLQALEYVPSASRIAIPTRRAPSAPLPQSLDEITFA